jgi:hypothetical protein
VLSWIAARKQRNISSPTPDHFHVGIAKNYKAALTGTHVLRCLCSAFGEAPAINLIRIFGKDPHCKPSDESIHPVLIVCLDLIAKVEPKRVYYVMYKDAETICR